MFLHIDHVQTRDVLPIGSTTFDNYTYYLLKHFCNFALSTKFTEISCLSKVLVLQCLWSAIQAMLIVRP